MPRYHVSSKPVFGPNRVRRYMHTIFDSHADHGTPPVAWSRSAEDAQAICQLLNSGTLPSELPPSNVRRDGNTVAAEVWRSESNRIERELDLQRSKNRHLLQTIDNLREALQHVNNCAEAHEKQAKQDRDALAYARGLASVALLATGLRSDVRSTIQKIVDVGRPSKDDAPSKAEPAVAPESDESLRLRLRAVVVFPDTLAIVGLTGSALDSLAHKYMLSRTVIHNTANDESTAAARGLGQILNELKEGFSSNKFTTDRELRLIRDRLDKLEQYIRDSAKE